MKQTIVIMAVIMIGGVQGAKAFGFSRNNNFDTPRTLELQEQFRAVSAHQKRLEQKRALVNNEIDQDAALKDRIKDEIKSIRRRQREDIERQEAMQKRMDYNPGALELENTYKQNSARLSQVRTQAMADYGGLDGKYKRVGEQADNRYLLSRDEYDSSYRKQPGIYYEGGN